MHAGGNRYSFSLGTTPNIDWGYWLGLGNADWSGEHWPLQLSDVIAKSIESRSKKSDDLTKPITSEYASSSIDKRDSRQKSPFCSKASSVVNTCGMAKFCSVGVDVWYANLYVAEKIVLPEGEELEGSRTTRWLMVYCEASVATYF